MDKKDFEKALEKLENSGWYENGDIACPAVGGDHSAKMYVNDKRPNEPKTVCSKCGDIIP